MDSRQQDETDTIPTKTRRRIERDFVSLDMRYAAARDEIRVRLTACHLWIVLYAAIVTGVTALCFVRHFDLWWLAYSTPVFSILAVQWAAVQMHEVRRLRNYCQSCEQVNNTSRTIPNHPGEEDSGSLFDRRPTFSPESFVVLLVTAANLLALAAICVGVMARPPLTEDKIGVIVLSAAILAIVVGWSVNKLRTRLSRFK